MCIYLYKIYLYKSILFFLMNKVERYVLVSEDHYKATLIEMLVSV